MTIPHDYARCHGKYDNIDHHSYEGNEMTTDEIMILAEEYADASVGDYLYGGGTSSHLHNKLRTAIEELAADARRYQWIKAQKALSLTTDGSIWTRDGIQFQASHYMATNGTQWGAYETLDQLIDAAMKEQI